jgi:hypothetical protein
MPRFDDPLIHTAACLAAAFALSSPASAQVCSGGPDGGMDATGNQCNAWVATSLPTGTEDVPATVLMPAPSRAANDAAIRRTSLLVDESPASAAPAALLRARQERSSGRAGSASGR